MDPVKVAPCPHEAETYFRGASVSDYIAGASECHRCRFVLCVVEEFKPGWVQQNKDGPGAIRVIKGHREPTTPRSIELLHALPPKGRQQYRPPTEEHTVGAFELFRRSKGTALLSSSIPLLTTSPLDSPFFGRKTGDLLETLEIVDNSRSEAAIERIQAWLSHCLEHDKECQQGKSSYMPRRLLRVEPNRDLYLFEPQSPEHYITLSYCWGLDTNDILKTTKLNLQSHYHSIAPSLLPATICDAVELCRRLGVSCLWVDSLCIVQDDEQSWLEDSAQMAQIYQNSLFTIAAEEPASCKDGFLGLQRYASRDWQWTFATHVPSEEGGPEDEVIIRPKSRQLIPDQLPITVTGTGYDGSRADFTVRPMASLAVQKKAKCSLDKRGWCLQETILPNRRLCFNGKEMTWECCKRRICECGHTLLADKPSPHGEWRNARHLPRARGYLIGGLYGRWRALVEDYSDRALSNGADKLSAVSGLALTMRSMLVEEKKGPQNYEAGLWLGDFLCDLAWQVVTADTDASSAGAPQPYRAPSWSWASVNESIRYDVHEWASKMSDPYLSADCAVDAVTCVSRLVTDPTGPIKSAHVILTGKLAPVELVVLDEALSSRWDDAVNDVFSSVFRRRPLNGRRSIVRSKNLWSIEVFMDRPQETSLSVDGAKSTCWVQGCCECNCCGWENGQTDQRFGELYCFPIFTWRTTAVYLEGRAFTRPSHCFLVLRRSKTVEDVFERVGIGYWSKEDDLRPAARVIDEMSLPLVDSFESVCIKIV
jgi:hypothetical protein